MSPLPRLVEPSPALRWARAIGQVLLLSVLWFIADRAAKITGIPVSGGILGLGILVLLLLTGMVKPTWVESGAELLLANMLLYFIPLVVSVVQYTKLFENLGLKLMIAIGVGFMSVMLVTAVVVEGVCQLIRKRHFATLTETRQGRVSMVKPS